MSELFLTIPLVFAQNAAGGAGAAPSASLLQFLPYIAIFGLYFWFIMIRPQQKQEKARLAMIAGVKKNDKVLTTAGIYGTVVSVDSEQDRIMIRIDDDKGIRVAFSKGSIIRVLDSAQAKEKEKAEAV